MATTAMLLTGLDGPEGEATMGIDEATVRGDEAARPSNDPFEIVARAMAEAERDELAPIEEDV